LDVYKLALGQQYEAAFCTLNACIDRCPDAAWNAPVVNLTFNQVLFHALFYADLFLGRDVESLRAQEFHQQNPEFFRDYEEFQDRAQTLLYERTPTKAYLQHCRTKAAAVIAAETEETLSAPCGFERRNFSRAELHVYNIRHLQHHAACLNLRLRI